MLLFHIPNVFSNQFQMALLKVLQLNKMVVSLRQIRAVVKILRLVLIFEVDDHSLPERWLGLMERLFRAHLRVIQMPCLMRPHPPEALQGFLPFDGVEIIAH